MALLAPTTIPTTLRWIGNLNSEVHVCVAWHTSPVKTIQDAMQQELIVGAAAGADSELAPHAFNNFLGTKFKVIPGYQDGPRILLAMQRTEVYGRCGWSWSSVVVQHPEWIKEKTISAWCSGRPSMPTCRTCRWRRISPRATTTGRRSSSCSATS